MNMDISVPTIRDLLFEQIKAISVPEAALRLNRHRETSFAGLQI